MTDNELLLAMSNMLETTLKAELEPIKTDLESVKTDLESVKVDMESVKAELEPIKTNLGKLNKKFDKSDKKITNIELILENETNKEIRIIAEGHLDLSRKLDEALKINNEKEILLLRVTHLENELRKTKERIDEITNIA